MQIQKFGTVSHVYTLYQYWCRLNPRLPYSLSLSLSLSMLFLVKQVHSSLASSPFLLDEGELFGKLLLFISGIPHCGSQYTKSPTGILRTKNFI